MPAVTSGVARHWLHLEKVAAPAPPRAQMLLRPTLHGTHIYRQSPPH